MLTNLERFDRDGIELIINTDNGVSFASVSGYARLSGKAVSTISERLSKVVRNNENNTAQIQTATGIKTIRVVSEDLISEWLPKDNPEMATKLLKLGVRMFMHKLAGYEIRSTAVNQPFTPQTYIDALKALIASEERKELLRLQNEQLEKENELLSEYADESTTYSSIIRFAKWNKCNENNFKWRELKAASQMLGLDIRQLPCARYGTKNVYHHDVWQYCYPNYSIPEKRTLRLLKSS